MILSIEDRLDRIRSTTHVVRVDDMAVYRVKNYKIIDRNIIFVETETDLWFQDLDVMTLEECSRAERAVQKIKDNLQK